MVEGNLISQVVVYYGRVLPTRGLVQFSWLKPWCRVKPQPKALAETHITQSQCNLLASFDHINWPSLFSKPSLVVLQSVIKFIILYIFYIFQELTDELFHAIANNLFSHFAHYILIVMLSQSVSHILPIDVGVYYREDVKCLKRWILFNLYFFFSVDKTLHAIWPYKLSESLFLVIYFVYRTSTLINIYYFSLNYPS